MQSIYALFFFVRVFALFKGKQRRDGAYRPVSVIVCAHNEAANLERNLPVVLSQHYEAGYEVVVVNDCSDDDTAAVLTRLASSHDSLKIVTIGAGDERLLKGKKFALSKGVAAAGHDWLALIDADCVPGSAQWLELMMVPLCNGKEIVAGYGGYRHETNLLNAFTRWETLHTFIQYSTYSMAGMPYMAVGRNMACTKSVLLGAQSHPLWNSVPSGDDDLLVRIAGTRTNTAVVCYKKAFTYSDACRGWREWAAQKRRHLSTGKYYKTHVKLLLGLYGLTHAIGWVGYFALLTYNWKAALFFMGIRCKGYWFIWSAAAGKLREKNLIILFPVFDVAWMLYNFAFLPYITWKNKQRWT